MGKEVKMASTVDTAAGFTRAASVMLSSDIHQKIRRSLCIEGNGQIPKGVRATFQTMPHTAISDRFLPVVRKCDLSSSGEANNAPMGECSAEEELFALPDF